MIRFIFDLEMYRDSQLRRSNTSHIQLRDPIPATLEATPMPLTPFGKKVRQLRIEGDLLLIDHARALNVSSAYVSATETGAKSPSDDYVAKTMKFFTDHGLKADDLLSLADQSRAEVRMNLNNYQPADRELVAAFARRFSEMSEERKEQINKLVHGKP